MNDASSPASEHGAFAHLPAALRALLPEIATQSWPEESRADCARCVMLPGPGQISEQPWLFDPETRCCSYHPLVPNFLAGRALRRGGDTARVMAQRIHAREGVTPWGIRPPAHLAERYARVADERFGRDRALRCPFWVGGELTCGIWADRPGVCRTWYCKHEHGLHGAVRWRQLGRLMHLIESRLAELCVRRGTTPAAAAAPPEWLAWYEQCALEVERLDGNELAALAGGALAQGRADLVTLMRRPVPGMLELPEVLVPAVGELWQEDTGVRLSGYSSFDTVIAPNSIFLFLSLLDGARPWREAQAAVARDGGTPIADELVRELVRIGALEAPSAAAAAVIERTPALARWTESDQA